jgi:hypothetical protein
MRLALVLAALVFSLLGQSSAAATHATLRFVDDTTPPTLRGTGFQPREHVRVTVVSGATRTVKRVVATAGGRFSVRTPGDLNDCVGFAATAIGSKGTHAMFKRAPGQCALP